MASRLHEWKEQQEYLDRMLHHVKSKYDHIDIRREYREHMEDMLDYYVESGMDEDTAKHTVLEEMGDADSLGRVLNEIHNPVVGWIWRVSRWVMVMVITVSVLNFLPMVIVTANGYFNGWDRIQTEGDLIYETEIGEKVTIDTQTMYFDHMKVYDTGESRKAKIYFVKRLHWDALGISHIPWGDGVIRDNLGNFYHASDSNPAGYIQSCVLYVREIEADAETLIVDYDRYGRKFYMEIPLCEKGEVAE